MLSRKILFSVISIVAAIAMASGATYAYFTSSQSINGNVITTGTLQIKAFVQDTLGNSVNFTQDNVAPGDSYTRCLWVANTGSVAGRFKIYSSAESGDHTLGNDLSISSVILNPTSGACSGLTNPTGETSVYGPSNVTLLTNIPVRGEFQSAAATPFKILSSSDAMQGGYFSLYAVTVTLAPSSTIQDSSYTADLTVLGMQDAGSLSGW